MKRFLSLLLCVAVMISSLSLFTGCFGGPKVDALVIMTENLDGLFNPFYSTSATDSTIVSMTQIGMLSSKYVNGKVEVAFGDNEAVVTKDFKYEQNADGDTVYTFVIKNGIKFSDGHALTIEDVLFNLYVYLDPVYTGSATIYSIDIKGLTAYRTQNPDADSDDESAALVDQFAQSRAEMRLMELVQLFWSVGQGAGNSSSYDADYAKMKAAILAHSLSDDYRGAISSDPTTVTVQQLLKDYDYALELFRKELEIDFESENDAYTEEPYKVHEEFNYPIF